MVSSIFIECSMYLVKWLGFSLLLFCHFHEVLVEEESIIFSLGKVIGFNVGAISCNLAVDSELFESTIITQATELSFHLNIEGYWRAIFVW